MKKDVSGFDQDNPLTGGIQITEKYPGKARTSGMILRQTLRWNYRKSFYMRNKIMRHEV